MHHNTNKPVFTIETNKDNLSLHCTNTENSNDIKISHSVSYDATDKEYIYTIQFDHLHNTTHGNLELHATDAAGNTSEIQIPEFIIDMKVPEIKSITTDLLAGSYTVGEIVPIEVTFDEDVKIDVNNHPKLLLDSDDDSEDHDSEDEVNAIYNSGNETNKLIFNYTISEGENYNPLEVHSISGIITDLAGNHADLSIDHLPNNLSHIEIDTTAPALTQVTHIPLLSNNVTPSYVFTTDEAGTITSSLLFSTSTHATTGSDQTITFNTLEHGTYRGDG